MSQQLRGTHGYLALELEEPTSHENQIVAGWWRTSPQGWERGEESEAEAETTDDKEKVFTN